jgi:hypothetical protein
VSEYAEVLLVWNCSHCSKISIDLEVSYVIFIDIACAGALNPAFCLQGYVTDLLFTVTTLLIDRSLGNSGLRRIFFVICIEPQHLNHKKHLLLAFACLHIFCINYMYQTT